MENVKHLLYSIIFSQYNSQWNEKKKNKTSFINKFHGISVLWEQYILKHSMHLKFVSMWPIYFNLDLSAVKKK